MGNQSRVRVTGPLEPDAGSFAPALTRIGYTQHSTTVSDGIGIAPISATVVAIGCSPPSWQDVAPTRLAPRPAAPPSGHNTLVSSMAQAPLSTSPPRRASGRACGCSTLRRRRSNAARSTRARLRGTRRAALGVALVATLSPSLPSICPSELIRPRRCRGGGSCTTSCALGSDMAMRR
jgi:hypothetical protein